MDHSVGNTAVGGGAGALDDGDGDGDGAPRAAAAARHTRRAPARRGHASGSTSPRAVFDAWLSAGEDAKDIFLIQQLESVLETVVERVNSVSIGEVTLLDGGDGSAVPRHIASFPAVVRQVLEELHGSTGVDVPGILSGSLSGKEVSS